MDNYSVEKFLDKLYSNLYISDEVSHIKDNNDKRYESIRKYLERLERVHNKANTESKKELLKSLYYDKYIIKEKKLKLNKSNNQFGFIDIFSITILMFSLSFMLITILKIFNK